LVYFVGLFCPALLLVSQGNLSLTFHYFKRFTKFTTLHFQNTTQWLLKSHENRTSTTRHLL